MCILPGWEIKGFMHVTYLLLNAYWWVTGIYFLGCILCRPSSYQFRAGFMMFVYFLLGFK